MFTYLGYLGLYVVLEAARLLTLGPLPGTPGGSGASGSSIDYATQPLNVIYAICAAFIGGSASICLASAALHAVRMQASKNFGESLAGVGKGGFGALICGGFATGDFLLWMQNVSHAKIPGT